MWAQTTGGTGLVEWVQYGVLGLVILAALLGYIEFRPSIRRLEDDKKSLSDLNRTLVETYESEVIPLLVESTRMLARLAETERRRDEDDPPAITPRRPRR